MDVYEVVSSLREKKDVFDFLVSYAGVGNVIGNDNNKNLVYDNGSDVILCAHYDFVNERGHYNDNSASCINVIKLSKKYGYSFIINDLEENLRGEGILLSVNSISNNKNRFYIVFELSGIFDEIYIYGGGNINYIFESDKVNVISMPLNDSVFLVRNGFMSTCLVTTNRNKWKYLHSDEDIYDSSYIHDVNIFLNNFNNYLKEEYRR